LFLALALMFALLAGPAPADAPRTSETKNADLHDIAIQDRLNNFGLTEGQFIDYKISTMAPGRIFRVTDSGPVALIVRNAPLASNVLVSEYLSDLSYEEALSTYGEDHRVGLGGSSSSQPSLRTIELVTLFPKASSIL